MSDAMIAEIVSRVRNGCAAVKSPAEQEESATPQTAAGGGGGRDARGRFAKGNPGGPGNPFARQTARLRQALVAMVKEDDILDIAAMLIVKAKGGDLVAAKLLLSYVVGKPTAAPDPDRLDHDEWQLWKENTAGKEDMEQFFGGWPQQVALDVARGSVPSMTDSIRSQLGTALRESLEEDAEEEEQDRDDEELDDEDDMPGGQDRRAELSTGRPPMTNGANGRAAERPAIHADAERRHEGMERPPAPMRNGSNGGIEPATPSGPASSPGGRSGRTRRR
jgi:hypothetical protein